MFDKINNILSAENNVNYKDKKKDTIIKSNKATYLKEEEIVYTEGNTEAFVENRYNFHHQMLVWQDKTTNIISK